MPRSGCPGSGRGPPSRKAWTALNHAAGFIQRVLSKRMSLRIFPRLTFVVDDSMENGFRIAKKLRDIMS